MEFGPLALRLLLVIITQKIVWAKLCWTAQILTIVFHFNIEPLKKVNQQFYVRQPGFSHQ